MTQKIHTNKLHTKLGHLGEDSMHATSNQLHYNVKGVIELCEYCAMAKIKQKFLDKVAEERDLNLGEMIYLDIISQKKPSYGGSENCILIQDSKWA